MTSECLPDGETACFIHGINVNIGKVVVEETHRKC